MRRQPERISILVPFQSTSPDRLRAWKWLRRYWEDQLPGAEIIVGHDWRSWRTWWHPNPVPFSKTAAINHAFRRSHGDIIVILDADAYLPGQVITHCANRLRAARRRGVRTWFIPYRHLYRLTQAVSEMILRSDPRHPVRLPDPPPPQDLDGSDGSGWGEGHRWGAMIQIMPREALERVLGADPRFRGWGGEDSSLLHALDCLWGEHRKTPNGVEHIWHERLASGPVVEPWRVRIWDGQETGGANFQLAAQYKAARRNRKRMDEIVAEGHAMSSWARRSKRAFRLLTTDWWHGDTRPHIEDPFRHRLWDFLGLHVFDKKENL